MLPLKKLSAGSLEAYASFANVAFTDKVEGNALPVVTCKNRRTQSDNFHDAHRHRLMERCACKDLAMVPLVAVSEPAPPAQREAPC